MSSITIDRAFLKAFTKDAQVVRKACRPDTAYADRTA